MVVSRVTNHFKIMNKGSSTTGVVIGVLVVVVIAIVGWVAYSQGFFDGKEKADDNGGLEINVGGSADDSNGY